jgi:hypothetical protein
MPAPDIVQLVEPPGRLSPKIADSVLLKWAKRHRFQSRAVTG